MTAHQVVTDRETALKELLGSFREHQVIAHVTPPGDRESSTFNRHIDGGWVHYLARVGPHAQVGPGTIVDAGAVVVGEGYVAKSYVAPSEVVVAERSDAPE